MLINNDGHSDKWCKSNFSSSSCRRCTIWTLPSGIRVNSQVATLVTFSSFQAWSLITQALAKGSAALLAGVNHVFVVLAPGAEKDIAQSESKNAQQATAFLSWLTKGICSICKSVIIALVAGEV